MAIVADLSGNSPLGIGTDPHISRPGEQPALIPGSTTKKGMDGSAQRFGPFGDECVFLRISTTAAVNYAVNATATANSTYLPAGAIEYIRIKPGQYLSMIGASGDVYVDEAK